MQSPLGLLLLLLAVAAANASLSENTQSTFLRPIGSLRFRNNTLRRYRSDDGTEIIEPYVTFDLRGKPSIRKNAMGSGFYMSLPLGVDSQLGRSRSAHRRVLQLVDFQVSLRRSLTASWCRRGCSETSAAGFRDAAGEFKILFRCKQRVVCRRVFESLYFDTPDSDLVRSAFSFSFSGIAGSSRLVLKRNGLPVRRKVTMPLKGAEWFEGNKVLLYQIKAGCGQKAYDSFVKDLGYRMPADGSWPDVYRSPLLDNLRAAVRTSSQWKMVAEMRKNGRMVAQVVFNVNKQRRSLNSQNWFSADRVESSYPYFIGQSGYNYFSMAGHRVGSITRRFFINNAYGGCHNDRGFWAVTDTRDGCPWANRGWKGKAPVLVYNSAAGTKYQSGNTQYADQFLVYLRYSVPALAPRVSNPFRNDFEFEKGKLLLFTVKSHSNVNAYNAFITPKVYKIPRGNSLPSLYRSGFLENLPSALSRSGKRRIVAEMRTRGKVVARIVFAPKGSYNKLSWFKASNVVSSFPIKLRKSDRFNFFSAYGHKPRHVARRFFVSFYYRGCPGDKGFWTVVDQRDVCRWANKEWDGKGPLLLYNTDRSKPFSKGVKSADRFLIYLQ